MTTELRLLRNQAAHPENDQIVSNPGDVRDAIELVDLFDTTSTTYLLMLRSTGSENGAGTTEVHECRKQRSRANQARIV